MMFPVNGTREGFVDWTNRPLTTSATTRHRARLEHHLSRERNFPAFRFGEHTMKSASKLLLGTMAAALLTLSVGCQPPKPPAPAESGESGTAATASDNMTSNTTAGSETPAGETP